MSHRIGGSRRVRLKPEPHEHLTHHPEPGNVHYHMRSMSWKSRSNRFAGYNTGKDHAHSRKAGAEASPLKLDNGLRSLTPEPNLRCYHQQVQFGDGDHDQLTGHEHHLFGVYVFNFFFQG